MMTPDQKIEICKQTRGLAQKALFDALKKILSHDQSPSEIQIRDLWLANLRQNGAIFEDGWYSPPPHGMGLLVGSDSDDGQNRLNFANLRLEAHWPRVDIRLNTRNGLVFAYASPVDKKTGIIGDFQITLYFGRSRKIIDHLILCRNVIRQIFDHINPGVAFSQVSAYLQEVLGAHGLNNKIEYIANLSPADDVVGHTIPFVMENMAATESAILAGQDYDSIKQMISKKRIFIRRSSNQIITPGMAFTIEPRPRAVNSPEIPMISFHAVCAIHEDGKKELLTNFEELFDLCGMDYMKE